MSDVSYDVRVQKVEKRRNKKGVVTDTPSKDGGLSSAHSGSVDATRTVVLCVISTLRRFRL